MLLEAVGLKDERPTSNTKRTNAEHRTSNIEFRMKKMMAKQAYHPNM